jgi:hypothetical protein
VLKRLPETPPAFAEGPGTAADDVETRRDVLRLRADVHRCLAALAHGVEQTLPRALAQADRAWEQVDDMVVIDHRLGDAIADARLALERALAARTRVVRAVAAEGLLVLDAACGLVGLAERRLSSLIRLWVRSGREKTDLLPGGRPFLDLGPALAEAARAWA